jgi:hypothetical protein
MAKKIEGVLTLRDVFSKSFGRPAGALSKFVKKSTAGFKRIAAAVFSLKGAIAGIAGAVVIRQFARVITSTADWADEISKLNQRLGLSTEFLSEMAFVGDRSNVAFSELAIGFQRLTRRLSEFQRSGGSGTAAAAFDILGLRDVALSAKDVESLLPSLADAFQRLESTTEAASAAFGLFDSGGVSFLQFLKSGEEGIAALRKEAKELGLSITPEQARDAAAFNDSLTNIKSAFQGLLQTVVLPNLPALTEMLRELVRLFIDNRGKIQSFFEDVAGSIKTHLPDAIALLRSFVASSAALFELPLQARLYGVSAELRNATLREAAQAGSARINEFFGHDELAQNQRAAQAAAARDISRLIDEQNDLRRLIAALRSAGDDATTAGADPTVHSLGRLTIVGKRLPPEPSTVAPPPAAAVVEYKTALQGANAAFAQLSKSNTEFAIANRVAFAAMESVAGGMTDAMLSMVDGTKKASDALKDFGREALKTLTSILLKAMLTRAALAALGHLGFDTSPRPEGLQGPLRSGGGFQHGGIGHHGRGEWIRAHGTEAHIPTMRGAVPIMLGGGGSGGDTHIYNLMAIDVKDFDERLRPALHRERATVGRVAAEQYQNQPGIRARMGGRT